MGMEYSMSSKRVSALTLPAAANSTMSWPIRGRQSPERRCGRARASSADEPRPWGTRPRDERAVPFIVENRADLVNKASEQQIWQSETRLGCRRRRMRRTLAGVVKTCVRASLSLPSPTPIRASATSCGDH